MEKLKKLKASALVVTMIILGIMLVSTLSIALVAVQERKASQGEDSSNQAYYKAENGVEIVMQKMKDNAGKTLADMNIGCANGVVTSSAGYTVKFKDASDSFITDCTKPIASVKTVKSIGTVGGNQRAVEVAVADSLEGKIVGGCMFDSNNMTIMSRFGSGCRSTGLVDRNCQSHLTGNGYDYCKVCAQDPAFSGECGQISFFAMSSDTGLSPSALNGCICIK